MSWAGWNDFFAMGGYALYVWGAVVVTFACLGIEVVALRARRAALIAQRRTARDKRSGKRRKRP